MLAADERAAAVRANEEGARGGAAIGEVNGHGCFLVGLVYLVVGEVLPPLYPVLESKKEDPPEEPTVDGVRLGAAQGTAGKHPPVHGIDGRLHHDGLGRRRLELVEQLRRHEVPQVWDRVGEYFDSVALHSGVWRSVTFKDGEVDALFLQTLGQAQSTQARPDDEDVGRHVC